VAALYAFVVAYSGQSPWRKIKGERERERKKERKRVRGGKKEEKDVKHSLF